MAERIVSPFGAHSTADEVSEGIDDLDYRFRPYDPLSAYAQAKTAEILFAVEASRRWAHDGITVNAVGGRYLDDGAEAVVVDERPADSRALAGCVARYAVDPESAERLWHASGRLLAG